MCIRDSWYIRDADGKIALQIQNRKDNEGYRDLSLIHISEPTRRTPISYAVFCLKKKRQPPRPTPLYSSAASDVYKRQLVHPRRRRQDRPPDPEPQGQRGLPRPVSYTHLRAHETDSYLVCRLLLEKKTATTETYTSLFVGSVRCV